MLKCRVEWVVEGVGSAQVPHPREHLLVRRRVKNEKPMVSCSGYIPVII